MSAKILTLLNELFNESTPPDKESLLRLIDETFSFVRNLKEGFDSKDPNRKEEAVQEAQEMKKALEGKLSALTEKLGLDPAMLSTLVQDSQAITEEEKNLIESVKEKFEQIQKSGKHAKPYKPLVR